MTKTVCSRPMCLGRTGIKIVGQSSSCSFLSLGLFRYTHCALYPGL